MVKRVSCSIDIIRGKRFIEFIIKRTDTIKVMKESDTQRIGTEALEKVLKPLGMARYLEAYDNGDSGDYTKEKYDEQDITMEEFRQLRNAYYGE